jgi:trehalose 6-phosphate phosphatase
VGHDTTFGATARTVKLGEASLFLDLDGTLAPFTAQPEGVGPDAERNDRLRRLGEALDGRLAVVSGRGLDDLDRILEGAVSALAGIHGLQRRSGGRVIAAAAHGHLDDVVRELHQFAARVPGTHVELKPLSAALHYRGAPGAEAEIRVFGEALAARTGLRSQHGSMVLEILTPGSDKGQAIRAFMAEPPFAGTVPVFAGDDLTDEDGFFAARELGGVGILVGAPRPTFAAYRLEDQAAVHAWLEQALSMNAFVLEAPVEPSYRRI